LTDTNTFTLVLTDTLPSEVNVLTNTILVDGVPAPEIYDPGNHLINYQPTGTFTDTYEVGITFQVQVSSEVVSGTLITNTLDGAATINGESVIAPDPVEVTTVVVITPTGFDLFLPFIIR